MLPVGGMMRNGSSDNPVADSRGGQMLACHEIT